MHSIRRSLVNALPAQFRRGLPALALGMLSLSATADFDYIDFVNTVGLTFVGSAAQNGTDLRLTPASANNAGGAWFQTQQSVGTSFETSFTFQLGTATGADGFAFVVQNSAGAPLAGAGCELGYHGIANSLAVEFDTYSNSSCGAVPVNDPAGLHVSVHSLGTSPNSVGESASLGSTLVLPNFADGAVHYAKLRYEANVLLVFVDNLFQPVLSVGVNLSTLLALDQGRAYVGFTASTGGLFEVHDVLAWNFFENPPPVGNLRPLTPSITEPAANGQVVSPADLHMETGPFVDPNPGDQHHCTDWEVWTNFPSQRVWSFLCATGVEKLHTHLGDGTFENSHAGRSDLIASTNYTFRVRHSDDSGNAATQWSPFATRTFSTGNASTTFPLSIEDVAFAPLPRWVNPANGSHVILAQAATPALLRLESAAGALLLSISANNGQSNSVTNPASIGSHVPVRLQIQGGSLGLVLPPTDLTVVDEDCATHSILLPALSIAPGGTNYLWISAAGATFVGNSTQTTPVFTTPARGLDIPWDARQANFKAEVFATGFELPVNIVFVPNPGPLPGDPFLYVSELYGQIKVVARNGTVGTYASGLLDFPPTGAFPGSGEQGLSGIAVDPLSGDVFAAMLHAAIGNPSVHYPKIDRFHSLDGGRTASTRSTILDMVGESQGQSHQISNLTLAPDGKLICHMGDGFSSNTAQNLDSFRGKILRLNLNGSAATDNPFYNAANGINSRDYIFAYGVRNPFGGDWRAADDRQYVVENGPSIDRFSQVVPGRNFLWDGSDASTRGLVAASGHDEPTRPGRDARDGAGVAAEARSFGGPREVPHAHGLVVPAAHEHAIGGECDGAHRLPMGGDAHAILRDERGRQRPAREDGRAQGRRHGRGCGRRRGAGGHRDGLRRRGLVVNVAQQQLSVRLVRDVAARRNYADVGERAGHRDCRDRSGCFGRHECGRADHRRLADRRGGHGSGLQRLDVHERRGWKHRRRRHLQL